ncbi:MAG: pro-sigmaK processing inhibitor BofA family protein [Clostridia bacterium]|nr:pro-sigmaK processing inhibitor BofA family protein [Clostridia bacterium]
MVFDTGAVLLFLAGVFLLFLICKLLMRPIRWLLKLVFSTLLGGITILAGNWILGIWGWHLALNPLNAMILGVLGLPGMVMAEALSNLL